MPLHLPDGHKYHPVLDEEVIAVVRNHDHRQQYDYLDIRTGFNEGMDPTYWKDGYTIKDATAGIKALCCPGLLYPQTLTPAKVWSRIADRLAGYVFMTPPNWSPDPQIDVDNQQYQSTHQVQPLETFYKQNRVDLINDREHCAICADRHLYWAVSPPVFLSRHSRRWHIHADCLQHLMPRRQFGLQPVDMVDYV